MKHETKIIPVEFSKQLDFSDKTLEELTEEELHVYLDSLEEDRRVLDAKEPKNQRSDAYEAWAEEHEELEDVIDEVLERLDTLEGK